MRRKCSGRGGVSRRNDSMRDCIISQPCKTTIPIRARLSDFAYTNYATCTDSDHHHDEFWAGNSLETPARGVPSVRSPLKEDLFRALRIIQVERSICTQLLELSVW
jgi:hypothetical protein